jgi:hypothetical protein
MTRGMPGCRMRGAALGTVVPYGDVGAVEVTISPHPYLRCFGCDERLWQGDATSGATVLVCRGCERILDTRRVA